jgi:hypothetical protein
VCTRAWFFSVFVLALLPVAAYAQAPQQIAQQPQSPPTAPTPAQTRAPASAPVLHRPITRVVHQPAPTPVVAEAAPVAARPSGVLAEITLADTGFINGVRLANLGGRQDLFVPLPQEGEVVASELMLAIDDISAHEARRNLEVQVNDRAVSAIALDGKSRARTVRIPLGRIRPKDGYVKLSFLYSGAATLDRCIDVRSIGDSLTIRPETALEIDVGPVGELDVTTTAALMPRDVTIVLPGRRVAESEIATAVTVARSLIASGRRVVFHHGFDGLDEFSKRDESGHWTRGIVLIGPLSEAAAVIDSPLARVAGAVQPFGTLAAVRVGGLPALLVSDGDVVRAGRLFASPLRAATRGVAAASVGEAAPADLPTDRVTFEQLGVPPSQIDVFGRADLTAIVDVRRLPPETRPTRLLLDVMVAPDGAGARAVVSAFVNERLLASAVAATTEATHLDLGLPEGLIGNIVDVRVVVQRASAQGDCRFEPQGYPAQILGSSALILAPAAGTPHDFSDLPPHFSRGVKLLLPAADADHPDLVLGILAQVVGQLSPEVAPLNVNFSPSSAPTPSGPFIAVSEGAPVGASPRVRFDRGRVVVADRAGRTLLDVGGFVGGAVAQVVEAGDYPGVWIKPLAANGSAPSPNELHLDHGDVAFIDGNGVALAMSTERDTVVRVTYPDQVSWLTVAERFRSWIIAGLWLFATAALLFILQRMFRRRSAHTGE